MIAKEPDVCGGDACIAGTRIPVWCLVAVLKQAYPQLSIDELRSVFVYAADHEAEIEGCINANDG